MANCDNCRFGHWEETRFNNYDFVCDKEQKVSNWDFECEYFYNSNNIEDIFFKIFDIKSTKISYLNYLELICILNTVTEPDLGDINVGRLKMTILEECIKALDNVDWTNREPSKEDFINDVRSLFVEE